MGYGGVTAGEMLRNKVALFVFLKGKRSVAKWRVLFKGKCSVTTSCCVFEGEALRDKVALFLRGNAP